VKRVTVRAVAVAVAVAPVLTLLVVAACSKSGVVGKGEQCYLATDCAPGLVCVPQGDEGARICSDDLSGVAGRPPPEAGVDAGEGGDAPADGPPPVDAPPPLDTGTDTNPPPDAAGD
jgi:hypothetical protein